MIPPTCHAFEILAKMMTFFIVVSLLSLHSMPPGDKARLSGLDERTLQTLRSPTCVQRIAQTSAGARSLGSIEKSLFSNVESFCACGPNAGIFAPRVQRSFEAASGSQLLKLRLAAQEMCLLESCKQR